MTKFASGFAAAGLLVAAASAGAQDYPSRTVRMVTSDASGGGDFITRLVAQGLTAQTGQQFIVENRGGGVIAGEVVARSAPDGYTTLVYGNTLWLLPLMRKQVPYDTFRDFLPVSQLQRVPALVVIHPSLPVKSVKELIALARARPGEINVGTAAPGTTNHLASELFKYMTKTDMVRVSYRGAGAAGNALMSGEVQVMFPAATSAKTHVDSGRMKALAVSTLARSHAFPELPTVSEAGVPGFQATSFHGVFVPAKTPEAIVSKLHQEIARALQRSEVRSRLEAVGAEIVGSTPGELAAAMKEEVVTMGKVIREAGIQER